MKSFGPAVILAIALLESCSLFTGPAGKDGAGGASGIDAATPIILAPSAKAATVSATGDGYVAIMGDNGTINSSSDGIEWTDISPGISQIRSIAIGGGKIVAVGYAANPGEGIASSPIAELSWSSYAPSTLGTAVGDTLVSVAYGAGVFVAVGYTSSTPGLLFTSPDGDVWTANTPASADHFFSVSFVNGSFFAATQSGDTLYTSANGTAWSSPITVPSDGYPIIGVSYGNGLYLAASTNGNLISSPDGTTWASVSIGSSTLSLSGIAFAGDRFSLLTPSGQIFWTTEATSWLFPSPVLPPLNTMSGWSYTTILWVPFIGNGVFIVTQHQISL